MVTTGDGKLSLVIETQWYAMFGTDNDIIANHPKILLIDLPLEQINTGTRIGEAGAVALEGVEA